jgi:hypothetical protein
VEKSVYNKILDLTGFVSLPNSSHAIGPCVGVSNTTAFNFQFRGFHGNNAAQTPLRVSLSQMVLPILTPTGPYTGEFSVQQGAVTLCILD